MSDFISNDDRGLHDPCEMCQKNPATEIKGGVDTDTGKRKLWYICRACVQKIEDERKNR